MGFQDPPVDQTKKREVSERSHSTIENARKERELTVVVSDHRLELLPSVHSSLLRIGDDVQDGDSVESDHLLEVDVASLVSVRVLDREGVVLERKRERREG